MEEYLAVNVARSCQQCGGYGLIEGHYCGECGGTGRTERTQTVSLDDINAELDTAADDFNELEQQLYGAFCAMDAKIDQRGSNQ